MLPPKTRSACFFRTRFVRASTETENVVTGRFLPIIAEEISKLQEGVEVHTRAGPQRSPFTAVSRMRLQAWVRPASAS